MSWLYLIPLIILVGLALYAQRARRKQLAAEHVRAERIGVGTEVMTTSGLYGTVVSRDADGTVMLSIAPGVEVRWALAALRDAGDLPSQYRGPIAEAVDEPDEADSSGGSISASG